MEQYYGNDIDTIFIRETLMAICPVRKALLSEAGNALPSV